MYSIGSLPAHLTNNLAQGDVYYDSLVAMPDSAVVALCIIAVLAFLGLGGLAINKK